MHRIWLVIASTALMAFGSCPVLAQENEALSWQGLSVMPQGNADQVKVERDGDAEVLVVRRTTAMLDGVEFGEGVIEFDLSFKDAFGFGGLLWHAEGRDAEYFYIRQHKSGQPDAGQYTPIRNGLTSWQIYTDRNGIAPFAFTHEGWNHFKMVVEGDKADIYFNGGSMPILHIPDLATDRGTGGVGFRASGPNGELRFANLVIRDLAPGEGVVGSAAEVEAPPAGVIESWRISQAFDEAAVADALRLPAEIAGLPDIATVAVETTGIADITRAIGPEDGADTVLVSTNIRSDAARRVRLQFGYSDRVRLFLNGELVFDGDAGWRVRDNFFLGTIGFKDAVVLDLSAGDNELSAAVSETFGGWGFAGAIAEREGLTLAP